MIGTNTYLHFMGNAQEAFNFYKSVFGGEFKNIQHYESLDSGKKMSPEDRKKLIHITLQISDNISIMASDVLNSMEIPFNAGNNFHICIHTENEQEADRLFGALSTEGKIDMPLNKTFWGAYFGMCRDKFGIQWMINFDNQQSR
jgi:PhnB protein